jgi:hypothetical protein
LKLFLVIVLAAAVSPFGHKANAGEWATLFNGKGGSGGSITWVDPSTKTIYIMLQNMKGGDSALTSSTFLNTAAAAKPPK